MWTTLPFTYLLAFALLGSGLLGRSSLGLSSGLLGKLSGALSLGSSLGLGLSLALGLELGGLGGLGGLGLVGSLKTGSGGGTELGGETLDAPAGADELLCAGAVSVALVAQVYDDLALGGVRLPGVAAGAAHRALNVIRMDALLHVGLLRCVLVSDQNEG